MNIFLNSDNQLVLSLYLQHVHHEHDPQGVPELEQVLLVKPFLSPAGSEDGAEEKD